MPLIEILAGNLNHNPGWKTCMFSPTRSCMRMPGWSCE